MTDRDPRRAAELAAGWLEEYRRLTASLAVTEASQRRLFFERELNGARDELTRAEDNMRDTEQRTGVLDLDGQARAMIALAAMLRAQVAAKEWRFAPCASSPPARIPIWSARSRS